LIVAIIIGRIFALPLGLRRLRRFIVEHAQDLLRRVIARQSVVGLHRVNLQGEKAPARKVSGRDVAAAK
jgi:hypothetical protein